MKFMKRYKNIFLIIACSLALSSFAASKHDDLGMMQNIQYEMNADYALNGRDINIKAKNGVVTLFGKVNTNYEKMRAGEIASAVRDVTEVVNKITIILPFKHPSNINLQKLILKRLAANFLTQPVTPRIFIRIENGIATLNGNVDTWRQRFEVERIVLLTEGVWAINNRLSVTGIFYPWQEWYYNIQTIYNR